MSLTGCMPVKKSNTHMLYIFETQEPYVFIDHFILSDFIFFLFLVRIYVAREMDSANWRRDI